MKKAISVLMCVVLFLSSLSTCFADTLNKATFEKLDGYKYDKFDKTWSYYQAWSHQYKDAVVVIGINIFGGSDDQMPATLYCWIRDENNRQVLDSVNKMLFLIGDDVYSFDHVLEDDTDSSVLLGEDAKEFLQAMANASQITVRLSFKRASIDEEIKGTEYSRTLKAAAKAILNSNIWDCIDESWKSIAAYYAPVKN